jgi:peptidoglycan/LPS O-acetylase OafA/YrhL
VAITECGQDLGLIFDFIRAGAAIMVLGGHAVGIFPWGMKWAEWPQQLGVIIFFLLSGYLISQTLRRRLADPTSTFLDFAIDRSCRIYSGFLPALLIVCLMDYCASTYSGISAETMSRFTERGFFENLFMLQAPSLTLPFGSAAPFWSVAIEFWIYMFVGMLVFSIRDGISPYRLIVIGLTGIIPLQSIQHNNMVFVPWLLGATIEVALSTRPRILRAPVSMVCFIIFSMLVYSRIKGSSNIYDLHTFFLCAGAFASLAMLSRRTVTAPVFLKRTADWWASWSYSLYLLHHSILMLFATAFGGQIAPFWGIWLAVSTTIPFASFTEAYHRPIGRLLKSIVAIAIDKPRECVEHRHHSS